MTTAPVAVPISAPKDWTRNYALVAGIAYLVTFAAALGLVAVGSFWFIGVLPIALWERSVGIWMTFKGFSPSPLTAAAP